MMPRTTLDIDARVLRELKGGDGAQQTTVGRLASELLAAALHRDGDERPRESFEWWTQPMDALLDLRDKEALRRALEGR